MAPSRKTNIFPTLLFVFLVGFIALKVFTAFSPVSLKIPQISIPVLAPAEPQLAADPNSVRIIAQANPNPGSVATAAQPVPAICGGEGVGTSPLAKPPAPASNESAATEACAKATLDNLIDYITPNCEGTSCKGPTVTATSVTLTQGSYGGVTNYVEKIDNDGTGDVFKQYSNNTNFAYKVKDGYIRLMQDTIWGGGPDGGYFTCDNRNLGQAFYRAYDQKTNELGAPIYPTTVSCGTPNESSAYLKAFPKVFNGKDINDPANVTSQLATDADLGGDICKVANQTHSNNNPIYSTSTNKMIFNGKAKCNGQVNEMAAFLVTNGAGQGEVSMYCLGKGLCAWYQKLDFSVAENKPDAWAATGGSDADLKDLCQLRKAGGDISKLPDYFEYNLQRCENTPQTVLNNFVDEYSVSCVPQTDYSLDLLRKEDCFKTPKGCSNWNTTGELKFVAGNQLFGLFRNEELVKNRYATPTSYESRVRNESIEAYFSSPGRCGEGGAGCVDGHVQLNPGIDRITSIEQLSIYQSPLFKGSTLTQQCQLIYDKLEAVDELCQPYNRISGEENSECAINQYLPNTSLRYSDLYKKMKAAKRESCNSLMNPNKANAEAVAMRDQILRVDPSMEIGYRPAFIVLATLVNQPTDKNPQFRAGTSPTRFWQVDYLEIKVPTFGSDFLNRNLTKAASNPNRPGGSYQDPLRFTADILTRPEIQEKYREEEAGERKVIRDFVSAVETTSTGKITPGELIGKDADADSPIRCRDGKGSYSAGSCDNIARALITFINATETVDPATKLHYQYTSTSEQLLPSVKKCEVDEDIFYENVMHKASLNGPVGKEFQQAEEATTIGSKLEAKNVGNLQKKTDATADVEAFLEDMSAAGGQQTAEAQDAGLSFSRVNGLGRTRIFMVSPHKFTLLYAQNAFLGLLTKEQQDKVLNDPNFNSVLKTKDLDTFTNENENARSEYPLGATEPITPAQAALITSAPTSGQMVEVSAKIQKDNTKTSPLLWQAGGAVANLPTRMMALLTSPIGSKMQDFTLGCRGPQATEMWLKGSCVPAGEDKDGDGVGDTDGVNVSKTCINVTATQNQADAAAAKLRQTLAIQQMPVTRTALRGAFAGWAAYFGVKDRPDDQHLFREDCTDNEGNKIMCYELILKRVTEETNINPYLAIGISLNESGGLISSEPDFAGPHFGCGNGATIGSTSSNTIENKLECMIGFFARNKQLSDDASLRRYGYANGQRNQNLNKIIGIISEGEYKGVCDDDTNVPTPTITQ